MGNDFFELKNSIYSAAYAVLVNHILSWILYGELIPSPTFFITTKKMPLVTAENPEEIWSQFELSNDLIPDCISASLANRILFCGKVKRILKQKCTQ
jgi:hypothetical protein